MDAVRAKGWACTACARIYATKDRAEQCCRCAAPGCNATAGYTGQGATCRCCQLKSAIQYNRKLSADAPEQVGKDEAALAKLVERGR